MPASPESDDKTFLLLTLPNCLIPASAHPALFGINKSGTDVTLLMEASREDELC